MPIEFSIKKPANFDLATAVCGHGWYDLAPFKWEEATRSLSYVFLDEKGKQSVPGTIIDTGSDLTVKLANLKVKREKIERDVRHILRLDDDMNEFYAVADSVPTLRWVPRIGGGRLLRSATVFEDIVKTMCTTNCSWSLTKKMVGNLVDKLGVPSAKGAKSFPTAALMASVHESFYRNEIKAGYRSPYFVELAQKVAGGEIEPESFLTSELPTLELKKKVKTIKGFGDYAADNLLKLLGRYDGLALDSWLRAKYYEKHNRKKVCDDKKIHKHYKRFGQWQGLVIWCEMTSHWFGEDGQPLREQT